MQNEAEKAAGLPAVRPTGLPHQAAQSSYAVQLLQETIINVDDDAGLKTRNDRASNGTSTALSTTESGRRV